MIDSLLLFSLLLSAATAANCPSDDTGLTSFAQLYPTTSTTTDVTITVATLLDVTSLDVNSIVISGNGKLVFKPGNDISIRTRFIRITDNGELIIGSDECRFEDNVDIALYGNRTTDRSTVTEHGEKSITAELDGSIKIYGKDKLSWTKLKATVNMPTPLYRHKTDPAVSSTSRSSEGLAMTVLASTTLQRTSYAVYDFWKNNVAKEQREVNKTIAALQAVPDGAVVALALQHMRRTSPGLDLSILFNTIETLAGMQANSLAFRDTQKYDAFAIVFQKGGSYNQHLDAHIGKSDMFARASIDAYGKKVTAVSSIMVGSKSNSYVDVLVHSLAEGYPVLKLAHHVNGDAVSAPWEIDDELFIASTDYEWKHAERAKVKSFPETNEVELDRPLYYRHFGEIEHGVDMRAEVALLTRNIKINGELTPGDCPPDNRNCGEFKYDTYGCHIKVIHNFTAVHIEGAEIYHGGQPTDKGFYPIHFHMCLDVTDKEAVIRRNSIHDTFQRAITVHGTYGTSETALGVEILENVAVNVLGHAFFQEDGAERATSFIGNLAASIRKVKNGFFSTDAKKPTAFWFVTPETISINNVAAGGEGFGIWYTFPDIPVGPSKGLVYAEKEAGRTPLYTTDNNVAHSNTLGGLNFDNILVNEHGDVTGCMRYNPRVNPLDGKSAIAQVFMYRLTAYKNRNINAWLRGGGFYLLQASFAESRRAVQLASGGPQHQYISKSVILGESEGNTEYIDGYPDAFGRDKNGIREFDHYLGVVFYDGPVWIKDVFFAGFKSKENNSIVAGALAFKPENKFQSSIVSSVTNLMFGGIDATDINRVYDGDKDEDSINGFGSFEGDEVATFRDLDGSVVTCSGTTPTGPYQIYKPNKFLNTNLTKYRDNWKMAYSTDLYAKLNYKVLDPKEGFDGYSHMRRVNRLDENDLAYADTDGVDSKEFMAVLNRTDNYIYDFQFKNGFPAMVKFTAKGVEKGQNVIMGVCLPEGITKDNISVVTTTPNWISFKSTHYKGLVWVDDLDTLADDETMSRVMLKDRFLYVHFTSRKTRDPAWDKFDDDHCPGEQCPSLHITLNDGAPTSYSPCFAPTEEELEPEVVTGIEETCDMPAGTRDPSWGAGDTLVSKDGGIREWSTWSECCNDDADNPTQRTRTRACNYPIPYGPDAEECAESTTETTDCTTPCPVNGRFDDWTRWTDCACLHGSAGVKTRSRACLDTANGGKYCEGDSEQMWTCNGDC